MNKMGYLTKTIAFVDICAHPASINILEGVSGDVRLPARLCDGVNKTRDGRNAWLAPILPHTTNRYTKSFPQ